MQVPPPQAYFEPINWHRTALHELGHASGAPHRLNRDLSGSFGSQSAAMASVAPPTPCRMPAWSMSPPPARTTVHNLAYAQRLGLWGGEDFPFATRAEFVEAIEDGGVAAMEVLARDLKALGLSAARSLSYEGVEYELVEHQLTPEQVRIYDAYAGAFSIIHNNLDAAMRATNITGETGTLNAQAKSAARSAFESAKQRFFGHLLTSMKTPSLIRSIDRDLEAGHSAVIQIVSTGEALMERRLAEWRPRNGTMSRWTSRRASMCSILFAPSLPGAALRALHQFRRQSLVPAGLPRRAAGREGRGCRAPGPPD